MEKKELLNAIKSGLKNKTITPDDLSKIVGENSSNTGIQPASQPFSLNINNIARDIIYYLGGFVMLVGIYLAIIELWSDLGEIGQVASTLGVGIVLGVIAYFVLRTKKTTLYYGLFLVSEVLIAIGLIVLTEILGFAPYEFSGLVIAFIAIIMMLLNIGMFRFLDKSMFIVYGVFSFAIAYISMTGYIGSEIINLNYTTEADWFKINFMVLGLIILGMGYITTKLKYTLQSQIYYFIGTFLTLSMVIFTQSYEEEIQYLYDWVFPIAATGFVVLSVLIKSRAILISTSIMIALYVIYISTEYFYDSLGSAISLIVAGILIMAVSFVAFELIQRIKPQSGNKKPE